MFEAWGWINNEWVKGWDVGTRCNLTVFLADEPLAERVYLQDYEVDYDKGMPRNNAEQNKLIKQVLEVI